ncbi:uncharacterized protein LOC136062905 [Quercus suber]|uniref:uncharacterized protein LOC136062905 n=1 Tax=Quercus suber TaxID=58331 RepID=UPI000D27C75E|nr:hypothetical protein CFP56_27335 [Quercus suber]
MWACSELVIPFERDECLSFKDLIWRLFIGDASRIEVAAKVITDSWSLWNNQNEVRVGGARKIRADLIKRAVQYMEEFIAETELPMSMPVPEAQFLAWVPPTTHYFKVNVDGATFAKQKAAGVEVIIRDDQGQVIEALIKKIQAPLGAVEIEAKVFEAGMQFTKDIGIQDLILEGDSLTIYHALVGLSLPPTLVDSVVKGLQSFCGEFHQISFSHDPHQGNRPAHLLAKHAKGIVDYPTWMEENPYFLFEQALLHNVLSFIAN